MSVTDQTAPAPVGGALPFWMSLSLLPLVFIAATFGGWTVWLVPLTGWIVFSILDAIAGHETASRNPDTPDEQLTWYRAITLIWAPLQALTVFGAIWLVTQGDLGFWSKVGVGFSLGIVSGSVGIVYAHELMHQSNRLERWLGDILMAMALYGHFRSEHLLVHHRYVGTPRDPVTARYNESFFAFFPRVLHQCLRSAWRAERAMLERKNLPFWHRSNPFWRYATLQLGFLILAWLVGSWPGVALFLFQAFIAVWQLELVNYIEHYGLTREHLGDGRYEHTKPHHSWNAPHRATNWFLINLQRHSDHHFKPTRRFPLLQNYSTEEAPELPFGYPIMTALAMVPPLWRRRMNPRVREWRRRFYPQISDWSAYKAGTLPLPR